jgi:predicted phosphodiesterase
MPPDSMTEYIIKESDERLIGIMKRMKQKITFVGHTHQLGVYKLSDGILEKRMLIKNRVSLANGHKYIINCGSVGQPRDGYNEAKYMIWDSGRNIVEPRFVTYNYGVTMEKMKTIGIPKLYATVLGEGKSLRL